MLLRRAALLLLVAMVGCGSNRGGGRGAGGGDGGSGPDPGCLACFQQACSNGQATTITGKVTAPNGLDPVNGAVVYVPAGVVAPLTDGISCEVCSDAGANAIVTTITATDGSFTLTNVPATTQVPLVIQKGRFRRQVKLDVTACTANPVTVDQVRLPKNQREGDLPKMAVGVGDYDQIECVLRSIGIDESEFTHPGGTGAVHLYDNAGGMPSLESLLYDTAKLNEYNLVFVNCTGTTFSTYSNQYLARMNVAKYVGGGGRLYVTDWSYDYMEQVSEFAPYIFFDGGGDQGKPQPIGAAEWVWSGDVITASIGQPELAEWMKDAGASTNGTVQIEGSWALALSTSADQTLYKSTTWVHGNANAVDRPMTVTYDYKSCGKVLWSSYHTQEPGGGSPGFTGTKFPTYCISKPSTMIAQEKILEYLILQISSCIDPIG